MSDSPVRVRFAPSPTGALHIGGVRTALFNLLLARRHGGVNILRIEDTDQTRYVPGAEEYIIRALEWCGITFDEGPHVGGPHAPYRQSERKPMYRQYADQLIVAGHAYYAFDTEAEIEQMRERLKAQGNKSPQYNAISREHMKNSLTLPQDEVQRLLASGQPYVVRIKIPRKDEIRFQDAIRGWVVVHSSQMDDKVLLKSDGMPTYHLANVVDDHLMEITHVIRGEEWLPSAPLHVFMYQSFGWTAPTFAHLPLILRPDGNGKLSKRDGDKLGVPVYALDWFDEASQELWSGFREAGYLPDALCNFLALLGWNPGNDVEMMTREQMIELFSLDRVGKSGTKFDKAKLEWFNQAYIKQKPMDELLPLVKVRLEAQKAPLPSDERLAQIIDLLRDRVLTLNDFFLLGRYLFDLPLAWNLEEAGKKWNVDYLPALEALANHWAAETDWTPAALEASFKSFCEAGSYPLGKIMPMLRYVLTAAAFGPHVFDIMAFYGKERSLANLRGGIAALTA